MPLQCTECNAGLFFNCSAIRWIASLLSYNTRQYHSIPHNYIDCIVTIIHFQTQYHSIPRNTTELHRFHRYYHTLQDTIPINIRHNTNYVDCIIITTAQHDIKVQCISAAVSSNKYTSYLCRSRCMLQGILVSV